MIRTARSRAAAFLRDALRAYASIGRSLGGILLFLGSASAATAAIVVPMWLLASRSPELYSWLAAGFFAALLSSALILAVRRQSRASGGARRWIIGRFLPFLGRITFLALSLAAVYGLLLLYASRRYLPAAAGTLLYALLLGWRAHRRRTPGRSSPTPSPADADGDGNPP